MERLLTNLKDNLILFSNNLMNEQLFFKVGLAFLQLVLILIGVKILFKFGNFLIEHLFEHNKGHDKYIRRRNRTLKIVLQSGLKYTIYFVAGTMALEVIGVPTTSILAGAGVVGVAVGFGAQSLVKDVITGFFILFERQFAIDDYVKIDNKEGIVEEIGLRVTKIKNFDGDLHIIPNGNINQVTNLSASARRVVVDVPIDYAQNIDEAIIVLEKLCQQIKVEYDEVIQSGPEVLGVEELADSSVNLRVIAMTEPMESWQIARVLKRRVKETFDKQQISIPYNHITLVNKD